MVTLRIATLRSTFTGNGFDLSNMYGMIDTRDGIEKGSNECGSRR